MFRSHRAIIPHLPNPGVNRSVGEAGPGVSAAADSPRQKGAPLRGTLSADLACGDFPKMVHEQNLTRTCPRLRLGCGLYLQPTSKTTAPATRQRTGAGSTCSPPQKRLLDKPSAMNTYTKQGEGVAALCYVAFELKFPAKASARGAAVDLSSFGGKQVQGPKTGTRRHHGFICSAEAFSAARSDAEVRQGLGSAPEMSPDESQRLLKGVGASAPT